MANCCWFSMKAVSDSKDSLERLRSIMKYEDSEFFLYRLFSCDDDDEVSESSETPGLFEILIYGDVAWGASPWVNDLEDTEKKASNGAHYTNLQRVCSALNVSVEVWTQEDGVGFQEHILVNNKGESSYDSLDIKFTDSGDESEVVGGFEDYGSFLDASEMWVDDSGDEGKVVSVG